MQPEVKLPKSKSTRKETKAQELEELKIEKLLKPSKNQGEVPVIGKNEPVEFGNLDNAAEKKSENTKASKTISSSAKTSEKNKRSRSTRNDV